MNIRGLSPVTFIAGRPIRFELRPRDTLAWQFIDRLDRQQQIRLLAVSPEILAWCLLQVSDQTNDAQSEEMSIDDMLVHLNSQGPSADDVSIGRFCSERKSSYLRELRKTATDEQELPVVESQLQQLIDDACQLNEDERNEPGDAVRLAPDAWRELSSILLNEVAPVVVPVEMGGWHPGNDDSEEFQRQLQQEKLASMKQLAYGASHEINNPLANIASRAQTLLMDETDPSRRLKLAKINQQAFRAHEMIADMMLFAHPPEPEFTDVEPLEVIRQVVSEMQPLAEQQQTRLSFHAGTVNSGCLDKTQLAVAVKAMIQNSLESLQESGNIEVSISGSDTGQLKVTVSDDGPGIDPRTMNHLFDPFFSGREAGRGLGFGLSKAWRIAELHGGEISAESPSHGGARFCLRIPYRTGVMTSDC